MKFSSEKTLAMKYEKQSKGDGATVGYTVMESSFERDYTLFL